MYNKCNDDLPFPIHLFASVVPEWVDYLSGDIDGRNFLKLNV